jgi:para-aminobenzoate synthetase
VAKLFGAGQCATFILFSKISDYIPFHFKIYQVYESRSTSMRRPNLLYVDAYDSFANNITALLQTALEADVHVVKIDDEDLLNPVSEASSLRFLHQFDAVVVGPGPGNPSNPQDVGWVNRMWALGEDELLPVLGICLGFQSLCLAFGAAVSAP